MESSMSREDSMQAADKSWISLGIQLFSGKFEFAC